MKNLTELRDGFKLEKNDDENIIGGGEYEIPQTLLFTDNGNPEEECLVAFVIIDELDSEKTTQFVNCITSLRLQSFLNIQICLLSTAKNPKDFQYLTQLASDMNVSFILDPGRNIASAMNQAIKEFNCKYVTFIDFEDIIPRIKDVENAMYQMYTHNLDYLTFDIKYLTQEGEEFNFEEPIKFTPLSWSANSHYSVFFKRETLLNYSFDNLNPVFLDKKMAEQFKKDNKKGAFILGRAKISFIDYITPFSETHKKTRGIQLP